MRSEPAPRGADYAPVDADPLEVLARVAADAAMLYVNALEVCANLQHGFVRGDRYAQSFRVTGPCMASLLRRACNTFLRSVGVFAAFCRSRQEVVWMLTADQIASIIVARSGSFLTAMQLQKLLYYVQAWHAAVTDEPLFAEQFKCWPDGPVVPQVWHLRKDPGTRTARNQTADLPALDDMTSNLIDLIVASYGSMSGDELSALTHTEIPWKEARGDLADDAPSTDPIPVSSMAIFYRAHRKLGGRTAADLAAGGIHLRDHSVNPGPFDFDAFLESLGPEFSETEEDPFGGGNLEAAESASSGIETEHRRTFSGA